MSLFFSSWTLKFTLIEVKNATSESKPDDKFLNFGFKSWFLKMTIYLDSAMSPFHGCGRFDQWGSLTNGLRNFTRRWRSKFGFAVFDESGNPGFAVSCNCIRQLQIWLIWKIRTYPGELYQLRPFLCDLERFSTKFSMMATLSRWCRFIWEKSHWSRKSARIVRQSLMKMNENVQ